MELKKWKQLGCLGPAVPQLTIHCHCHNLWPTAHRQLVYYWLGCVESLFFYKTLQIKTRFVFPHSCWNQFFKVVYVNIFDNFHKHFRFEILQSSCRLSFSTSESANPLWWKLDNRHVLILGLERNLRLASQHRHRHAAVCPRTWSTWRMTLEFGPYIP